MEISQGLNGSRLAVATLVEHPLFVRSITGLIILNAITLGMETHAAIMASHGDLIHSFDKSVLVIFTLELMLKLYAYRLSFFRSGWNNFDLTIISIAWMPATGALAILRALRILRVLRLLSVVPQMRKVVNAIGHSIPGMTSVISVLILVFYVAAVMATKLFGTHPDAQMQEWFGSIAASAYTLFQIMTLESWSMGIVRPTMELFPMSWLFFIPFIVITSFAVLNLFIGIIVDSMQTLNDEAKQEEIEAMSNISHSEASALHEKLDRILESMEKNK